MKHCSNLAIIGIEGRRDVYWISFSLVTMGPKRKASVASATKESEAEETETPVVAKKAKKPSSATLTAKIEACKS